MFIDARLPVRFGTLVDRRAGEAVLSDGPDASPPAARLKVARLEVARGGHDADCLCCVPRSSAALALAGLFRSRAVGPGPAFSGVLAVVGPEGERAVRAALADDPLVSARYRLVVP